MGAGKRPSRPWFFETMIVALAVGVSLAAIVAGLLAADFARRAHRVVVLAAGSLLVGASLVHLIPEAIELGLSGALALGVGAAAGGLLEFGGRSLLRRGGPGGGEVVAQLALLALAAHSTVDGGIYAVTTSHDQASGVLVGLGLVLHEAPEGAVALFLALQTGWSRIQAVVAAVFASSLTTPVGWVLGSAAGAAAHEQVELLFAGSVGLLTYSGVRLLISGLRKPEPARHSGN